jgi:hypothetical protein
MTTTPIFNEVDAVQAAVFKPATLRASARQPTDPDAKWQMGMVWRPELCMSTQTFDYCEDVESLPTAEGDDLVYYRPIGIRVPYFCPTRQIRDIDLDRARRQLDAATSHELAKELWTGATTLANQYTTPTNAQTENYSFEYGGATTVGSGAYTNPAEALGALDAAARAAAHGQQVYLHMPSNLAQLDPYNFRRVGDILYTEQDSIVVVDSGYPTTGPDGASTAGTAWMFATGPVVVRLDTIDVETDIRETLDRNENIREIWATRFAAATFDPCVLFAVEVTLPS